MAGYQEHILTPAAASVTSDLEHSPKQMVLHSKKNTVDYKQDDG